MGILINWGFASLMTIDETITPFKFAQGGAFLPKILLSKKVLGFFSVGLVLCLTFWTLKRRTLSGSLVLERLSLPFTSWNNASSDLELGVTLAKKGDYAGAKAVFEKSFVRDPKNPSLLNNLGYLAAELGALEKASEYLLMALELSPHCAECLNNLGHVKMKLKRAGEGKRAFERAMELSPNYADAMLNLAVLHEADGDFGRALGLYRRALPFLGEEKIKKWVTLRISLLGEIPAVRNLASHEGTE